MLHADPEAWGTRAGASKRAAVLPHGAKYIEVEQQAAGTAPGACGSGSGCDARASKVSWQWAGGHTYDTGNARAVLVHRRSEGQPCIYQYHQHRTIVHIYLVKVCMLCMLS